jgi:hypothetical protein
MSEPLSIAASVAGLVSLSLDVVKILRKTITTIANAPKEAHELVDKLQNLTEVLQFLQDFVDKNDALVQAQSSSSANKPSSTTALPTLTVVTGKCSELLKKIRAHSDELNEGGAAGVKRRVLWFLDKDLLSEAGIELQRFITIFAQCKSFEGMCVTVVVLTVVSLADFVM